MPDSLHAGALLAQRYRLDELLTESAGGRFWRAHDQVLDRAVAIHVIARSDGRAEALLDAARRTAPHHDRRLLRVLDADRGEELCYVVNEWGSGTSLDIMLASSGPLAPRRAAWIVCEVAESLARAHDAGLDHGRMVPENVLIDHQGQVRIIGFAVDAALRGVATGRQADDLVDTVAVLYAALTGKWAGASFSQLPPAPMLHGEVLRPRQVRAGIPRPLDALCDQVINRNTGHAQRSTHDLSTMGGVAAALAEFVGDPAGMAQSEMAQSGITHGAKAPGGSWSGPAPTQPVRRIEPMPLPPTPPVAPDAEPVDAEPVDAEPVDAEPVELPTQAGIPVFDENDEVGWIPTRSEAPAPPPPFEDQPAKPLFAPEPADGEPARRPRPGTAAAHPQTYWPWESTGHDNGTGSTGSGVWPPPDTGETEVVPGRNWFRLAMGLGLGVLLLMAAVAIYHLNSGVQDGGDTATDPGATTTPTVPPLAAFTGITADDFDPQGSAPQDEYPELVPLAIDGDPATSWQTSSYKQNFGPGGLKDGVGLVLDLGDTLGVREIVVTTVGGPTALSAYVGASAPTGVAALTPVGTATGDGAVTIALDEAVSGRFVTIWLTSLPAVSGGFRGTIAEVVVKG